MIIKANRTQTLTTYRELVQAALHDTGLDLMTLAPTIGPQVVSIPVPLCGYKLSDLTKRANDLAMHLARTSILVEQIPNTTLAAVQVSKPQEERDIITWQQVIESSEYRNSTAALPMALGVTIEHKVIIRPLESAPHVIIAGQTGSGKSVCSTVLVCALMLMRSPQQVRLIIVDPKATDFTSFNGLPHLIGDVIDTPEEGIEVLDRLTDEMTARNLLFKELGARNIDEYNKGVQAAQRIPRIVVFVDELADLMMTSDGEIKDPLQRLLQKGRSSGIHVILATQQPKAEIIPTQLTTNAPTRIAFATPTASNSRIILDQNGAETLLGRGDALLRWGDGSPLLRMQAPNLEREELLEVLAEIKQRYSKPNSGWLGPIEVEATGIDRNLTPLPKRTPNNVPRERSKLPEKSDDEIKAEALERWIEDNKLTTITKSMVTNDPDLFIGHRVLPRVWGRLEYKGVIGPYDASAKSYPILPPRSERANDDDGYDDDNDDEVNDDE